MRALRVLAILLFSVPVVAHAERAPRPVSADTRIRKVMYAADDVVAIETRLGVSSMIVFGPDEKIQTVAAGDSVAWQVTPNQAGNILFVKPLEPDAQTNLNIVTDKRIYTFALSANAADSPKSAVYKVEFVYPDEVRNQRDLAQAQAMLAAPNLSSVPPGSANYDYGYKGSDSLRPLAVFDDGVKTFLRYPAVATEIPAIFLVNGDRSETLVNFRREGDYLVIDKVGRQFTLRKGDQWLCLFNLRLANAQPAPNVPGAPVKLETNLFGVTRPAVTAAPLPPPPAVTMAPAVSGPMHLQE